MASNTGSLAFPDTVIGRNMTTWTASGGVSMQKGNSGSTETAGHMTEHALRTKQGTQFAADWARLSARRS